MPRRGVVTGHGLLPYGSPGCTWGYNRGGMGRVEPGTTLSSPPLQCIPLSNMGWRVSAPKPRIQCAQHQGTGPSAGTVALERGLVPEVWTSGRWPPQRELPALALRICRPSCHFELALQAARNLCAQRSDSALNVIPPGASAIRGQRSESLRRSEPCPGAAAAGDTAALPPLFVLPMRIDTPSANCIVASTHGRLRRQASLPCRNRTRRSRLSRARKIMCHTLTI